MAAMMYIVDNAYADKNALSIPQYIFLCLYMKPCRVQYDNNNFLSNFVRSSVLLTTLSLKGFTQIIGVYFAFLNSHLFQFILMLSHLQTSHLLMYIYTKKLFVKFKTPHAQTY